MSVVKGFLVVLTAFWALWIAGTYFTSLVVPANSLNQVQITWLFFYALFMVVGGGMLLWAVRTVFAHVLVKYGLKSPADFRALLGNYGISHFPLIIGAGSVFFVFFGNIGIFLGLFLATFSLLFMYLFFCQALMHTCELGWKGSLCIMVASESLIIILALLIWGSFAGFDNMANVLESSPFAAFLVQ
jgi:hypothetical protein